MLESSLDHQNEEDERVSLIGLGPRGCAYVHKIQQACRHDYRYNFYRAFLINDDPDAGVSSLPDGHKKWVNNDEIIPDLTHSCLGVVIVGTEYLQMNSNFKLRFQPRTICPTLTMGIVLPPLDGQPVQMSLEQLEKLDAVMQWSAHLARPEQDNLLHIAVNDWSAPIYHDGFIGIDLSDMCALFRNESAQSLIMMGTANAALETPQEAMQSALENLYHQGFNPEACSGLLAVVVFNSDEKWSIEKWENALSILHTFEPFPFPMVAAGIIYTKQIIEGSPPPGHLRVTVFAARPATSGICK